MFEYKKWGTSGCDMLETMEVDKKRVWLERSLSHTLVLCPVIFIVCL